MDFYRLSTDEGKQKKFAYGIGLDEYPQRLITCDICGREWKKGMLLDEDTLLSICLSNEFYPDFLNVISHTLVSEKAKDVLAQETITGYKLGIIDIIPRDEIPPAKTKKLRQSGYNVKKISNNPPNYYRLFAERSAELHIKSEVFFEQECTACGYRKFVKTDPFKQEYIRKDSWNGSDLFMVKEFGAVIYCTERFVETYQKHNLTGLLFRRVESI